MDNRSGSAIRSCVRAFDYIATVVLALGLMTVCNGNRPATECPMDLVPVAVDGADSVFESLKGGASLEGLYPNHEVLARLSGSFASTGRNETLLLLQDQRQLPEGYMVHETHWLLWVPEGAAVDEGVGMSLRSSGYRDIELEMLAAFSSALGAEHRVFPVADLNENGRDEIFFLSTHGMGSSLLILEYDQGEFRYLMRGSEGVRLVTKIDVIELPDESRGLRVYNLGSEDGTRGTRDWYEYAWDHETGQYEVVRQGNEEWDEVWW